MSGSDKAKSLLDTKVPLLATDYVLHMGTLNVSEKGQVHSESLEGSCLSVSLCPHAWRSIAKLGGYPLWKLSRKGSLFLDILAVERCSALKLDIESWGFANGYSSRQSLWRTWLYDSESDAWGFMTFKSESEAMLEAQDDIGPNGGPVTEPFEVLVGSHKLCHRMGYRSLDDRDAFDLLVIAWAEDNLPEVDGVWWAEDYYPAGLSSPRGGIFPSRVSSWSPTPALFEHYADDVNSSRLVSRKRC